MITTPCYSDFKDVYYLVKKFLRYDDMPDLSTFVERSTDSRHQRTLVAIKKDKVVGAVIYRVWYDLYCGCSVYINELVVEENYRRKGIGRSLVKAVCTIAKKSRAKNVTLNVFNDNAGAIAFYKTLDGCSIEDAGDTDRKTVVIQIAKNKAKNERKQGEKDSGDA